MSRRTPWGVALVALGCAAPIQAQTQAQLQRQIDSLAPLVERAALEAEATRLERIERQRDSIATRVRLDTIQVQGMTIVTPQSDAATARELFAEVWSENFVGIESRTLSERTFAFQSSTYSVEEIPVDGIREQVVAAPWHSRGEVKARIRGAVARSISAELGDVGLGRWVAGDPFVARDPEAIYRAVVLSPAQAVRRCLDGATDMCTSALGLDLGPDVAETWYTPEERRDRVLAWAGFDDVQDLYDAPADWNPEARQALESCVRLSTNDACNRFVDPGFSEWAPIPAYVRETVVTLAMELGGPGAWTRLVEDPAMSPEEALPYAAGVSLDELIGEWRNRVVASRPDVHAGLGGSSLLALLWVLIFAALATRSTRWRFN